MQEDNSLLPEIVQGKYHALLKQKCPRCHSGDVFIYPILSSRFSKMYTHCPTCGQKFEIEPGFFYGSMYISYGLSLLIGVAVAVPVYYLMKDPPVWVYMSAIIGVLLIISPAMFRYSRLLMLYWFGSIKFDPQLAIRNTNRKGRS
jgi:uncharacterized protein (DUF983 family)